MRRACIAGAWRVFSKADEPGWRFLLLFIPVVGLIVRIMVCIGLAERYGRPAGFGIVVVLFGFIILPILAGGAAQYTGARVA